MRYRIVDAELGKMFDDERYVCRRFDKALHKAFRKVMGLIVAVPDRTGLYRFKGLRLEKLSGDRAGQHSIRLNDQFRLVVRFEADRDGQIIVVVEVVDYH